MLFMENEFKSLLICFLVVLFFFIKLLLSERQTQAPSENSVECNFHTKFQFSFQLERSLRFDYFYVF